ANRIRCARRHWLSALWIVDYRHYRDAIDRDLLDRQDRLRLDVLGRKVRDLVLRIVVAIANSGGTCAAGEGGQNNEHRDCGSMSVHIVTLIDSSLSCRGSTSDGAPLIRSTALPVFGNARTSRNESVPHSIIHSRSTPKAHPPCGGAP